MVPPSRLSQALGLISILYSASSLALPLRSSPDVEARDRGHRGPNLLPSPKSSPSTQSAQSPQVADPDPDSVRYSSVFAFGASYQDNGRDRPDSLASTRTSRPYYDGRWSNGPALVEHLSRNLGANLVSYAYGGAHINNDDTAPGFATPDTSSQVDTHLSEISRSPPNLGSDRTLYQIWIGINPLTSIWSGLIQNGATPPSNPPDSAVLNRVTSQATQVIGQLSRIEDNLSRSVTKTTSSGHDYLVLPIPPLELVRSVQSAVTARDDAGKAAQLQLIQQLVKVYNAALRSGVRQLQTKLDGNKGGSKALTWDVEARWYDMHQRPTGYGLNATSFADPCLDSTRTPCSVPAEHLYWDGLHPTTTTTAGIAADIGAFLQRT